MWVVCFLGGEGGGSIFGEEGKIIVFCLQGGVQ